MIGWLKYQPDDNLGEKDFNHMYSFISHRNRRSAAWLCVLVLMLCTFITACSSGSGSAGDGTGEVINISESSTGSGNGVSAELIELNAQDKPSIYPLMESYFEYMAMGDTVGLEQIMVEAPDAESVETARLYVDYYQNIRVYMVEGPSEGTYAAYTYYEVKFKNIDTAAPSLVRQYIQTNEDGQLYIGALSEDSEVKAWMDQVNNSDAVKQLIGTVNDALIQAAQSDERLAELMTSLGTDVAVTTEAADD